MSYLKYEFTLNKVATVQTSKGQLPIGDVSEYFDNNGNIKVTIKFHDKLPRGVIDQISKSPELISIVGQASDLKNVELINQPIIHLPN